MNATKVIGKKVTKKTALLGGKMVKKQSHGKKVTFTVPILVYHSIGQLRKVGEKIKSSRSKFRSYTLSNFDQWGRRMKHFL